MIIAILIIEIAPANFSMSDLSFEIFDVPSLDSIFEYFLNNIQVDMHQSFESIIFWPSVDEIYLIQVEKVEIALGITHKEGYK